MGRSEGSTGDLAQAEHPESYTDVLDKLVRLVFTEEIGQRDWGSGRIDPERTTVIDHGRYQGTQIFILCLEGYQPDGEDYLWFDNYYGSCSICDALEGIRGYRDDSPTDDEVKQYMDLALHMVQRIKWLSPVEASA